MKNGGKGEGGGECDGDGDGDSDRGEGGDEGGDHCWLVDLGNYNDTVLDNENYEVSYAVLKPETASSW